MKRGWIYVLLVVVVVLAAVSIYTVGILQMTWKLLAGSFWGIIVPTLVWVWQWIIVFSVWIWQYVIVFSLWLLAGGFAAAPLIVSRAHKFYRQCRGHRLMQTVICVAAILLGWLWLHLWTASVVLWAGSVFPSGLRDLDPFGVGLAGAMLSYLGLLVWLCVGGW